MNLLELLAGRAPWRKNKPDPFSAEMFEALKWGLSYNSPHERQARRLSTARRRAGGPQGLTTPALSNPGPISWIPPSSPTFSAP